MLFVQSLNGISHNKIEDTREEDLKLAVEALDNLASKTMEWIQARAEGRTNRGGNMVQQKYGHNDRRQ